MNRRIVLAACSLLVGAPLAAQAPAPMTVSAEWLKQHRQDPGLVLLQVGDPASFDSLHIPGARPLLYREFAANIGQRFTELPPPAQFDSILAAKGVNDNSRIIIYEAGGWYTPAARAYLTMVWAGLGDRTSFLDGGIEAWQRAGGQVTAAAPPAAIPGRLTLHPRSDVIVTEDWLASRLGRHDVHIIDARDENFYRGDYTARDTTQRPGHIPGAFSLPYTSMLDIATGLLLPADRLRTLFQAAGAVPGDTVITYCHIGQQGSLVWFAARTLGYTARLFDGSYTVWSANRQFPIER